MAKVTFLKKDSRIEDALLEKVNRARGASVQAFFMRQTFPQYVNAQKKRWDTENASEEDKWKPLNPKYAEEKKRRFADYPGAGEHLLIATGKLAKSATAQDLQGINVIATDRFLEVRLNQTYLPYVEYVADVRPVMEFSDATLREMHKRLVKFVSIGVG